MKRDRNGRSVEGSSWFAASNECSLYTYHREMHPVLGTATAHEREREAAKAALRVFTTVNYERAKIKALGETLTEAKKDLESLLKADHPQLGWQERVYREREVIQDISDLLIDSLSKLAMIDLKQHM